MIIHLYSFGVGTDKLAGTDITTQLLQQCLYLIKFKPNSCCHIAEVPVQLQALLLQSHGLYNTKVKQTVEWFYVRNLIYEYTGCHKKVLE